MPEIPLFNGGKTVKTGDIPQMPLNNQRMPRADFRGIVSGLGQVAQAQGLMAEAAEQPTLDKDMFAGLDKGYQALAAGIKDLGQVAQKYAEKRQEVINDRDIGLEENSLEGVIAEARLGRNPARPETWNTDLSARMGAWKKALDANPNYSRHVKEAMTQKFNQRMQLEVSQTAASSSEAVFRQAGDVQLQRAERYAAEGNLSKAKEILVGANANRYITTDQATARAEDAKSISDTHNTKQQAAANPVAVVKALTGGGNPQTPQAGSSWLQGVVEMSGFLKQQILLVAQKNVELLQTGAVEGALAAMADGRIKSGEQLRTESLRYNPNQVLDDSQMEKLGALVDGRKPTEEEVNLVWRKIFEQNGVEDAGGIGRERLRREILLSGPANSKEMLGVFEAVRGDNKLNVGALRTGLEKIHDAHVAGRLGVRHDGEAFLAEAIQDPAKLAPFGLDGMAEVLKTMSVRKERVKLFYEVLGDNKMILGPNAKKGGIVDYEALARLDPFTQDLLKNVADGKRGRELRVQTNVDDSARREREMMNQLYLWVSSSTSPIDNGAIDKWMSGQVEGYGRREAGDTLMRRR